MTLEEVQNVAVIVSHGGDCLPGIQSAAAAKADDKIAVLLLCKRGAILNRLYLGLAWHGGVTEVIPSSPRKAVSCLARLDRALLPPMRGFQIPCQRPNFPQRASAENDSCGGGKFKAHAR